jgi:type III pantothenate kinase
MSLHALSHELHLEELSMILAIDIGNTHSVLGLFDQGELIGEWRVSTQPHRTADEMGTLIHSLFRHRALLQEGLKVIEGAILSSVVPSITETFTEMVRLYCEAPCLVVGPGVKTGMPILYDNPREVGADRIVNSVAAYQRWRQGLIVVDFGTATTFDVVTPEGAYLGGAIFPGMGISSEALFLHAARLPRVELSPPPSVIGRNTVHSIQSGLVYGYVGLVEGLVERMRQELDFNVKVVATGGLSPLIAKHTKVVSEVCPQLTLEGLRLIYDLNQPLT